MCRLQSQVFKVNLEGWVTGWLLCECPKIMSEHFEALQEQGQGKAAKGKDKSC